MSDEDGVQLEARLEEQEAFDPPEEFVEQANVSEKSIYEEFEENWPECWEQAADLLDWEESYDEVLDASNPPFYEWFTDGKLNASANCLDRHLDERGDEELAPHTALVTELFVEDMEGQLREAGIGDPTVGKKIGNLMSSMGGRLGTYRDTLAKEDRAALAQALRRNVTMSQEDEAEALAERMIRLHKRLERTSSDRIRAGEIAA